MRDIHEDIDAALFESKLAAHLETALEKYVKRISRRVKK